MGIGGMLGRRVAAAEGGYFASRSKEAITTLRKKQQQHQQQEELGNNRDSVSQRNESKADVLPEILKHSIPISAAENESAHSGLKALDKFSQYNNVELERPITISHRAWSMAKEPVYVHPSTANEMRIDRPSLSPEQTKLVVEGYLMIVKAFLVATALVFGGAVLSAKWIKTSLDIHTLDDIPVRGRELLQPKVEGLRQMLEPVRARVHRHRDGVHEREGSKTPSEPAGEPVDQGVRVKH